MVEQLTLIKLLLAELVVVVQAVTAEITQAMALLLLAEVAEEMVLVVALFIKAVMVVLE